MTHLNWALHNIEKTRDRVYIIATNYPTQICRLTENMQCLFNTKIKECDPFFQPILLQGMYEYRSIKHWLSFVV